ncbi:MAG: hypothetical protein FWH01_00990 [Oscillospiraceae bacterium]|nr:hypothetical protein [Oscillospiraceae bacterium]
MRKLLSVKNWTLFVFITFIGSTIYVAVRMILAPTVTASPADDAIRVKGDYILLLLSCMFGAVAMLLPGFLIHRVNLNIPSYMIIAYAVFLYCAIYLGEVRSFYYRVPHWDTILHTFSGIGLGALGFSVVSLFNKSDTITFRLSPVFVALFAFCFAIALGVVWEIYEFTMDYILLTNMQKHSLESGEMLLGQNALMDTMKDLIVDAVGAFFISAVGYVSLKYDKNWLDKLHIRHATH